MFEVVRKSDVVISPETDLVTFHQDLTGLSPSQVRAKLLGEGCEVLSQPLPDTKDTAYSAVISEILNGPRVNFRCRGRSPRQVSKHLFATELNPIATRYKEAFRVFQRLVERACVFTSRITGRSTIDVDVRNWATPADLTWHLDTTNIPEGGVRMILSFDRGGGVKVTPSSNLELQKFYSEWKRNKAFLEEITDLIQDETRNIERFLKSKPDLFLVLSEKVEADYILDHRLVYQAPANGISIHLVEGSKQPGTIHRASYRNHEQHGVSVMITSMFERGLVPFAKSHLGKPLSMV
ncbi:MAG: hypothetical protein R3A13_11475 [Bdellovibrionota bacterium]